MAVNAADLKARLVPEVRGMIPDGPASATGSAAKFERGSPTREARPIDDPDLIRELGFEGGARRFFHAAPAGSDPASLFRFLRQAPITGGAYAITSVAVVRSPEAAASAALRLFPQIEDPSWRLPPGLVRTPFAIPALPNSHGMTTKGPGTLATAITFSEGRVVYWLYVVQPGALQDPLEEPELIALMVALCERVRALPSPAAPEPALEAPPPCDPDPDAVLLEAWDLTVSADYHQVHVFDAHADWSPSAEEDASDASRDPGRHLGDSDGYVVMQVPSQYHFDMPMRIELWSGEPADLGDWQEIADVDLPVPSGVLAFMALLGEPVETTIPKGRYRARFCGGGFTEYHVDGDESEDRYLVRLWPSDVPLRPAQRRTWDGWE